MSDLFAFTDRNAEDRLAQASQFSVDSLNDIPATAWRGTAQGIGMGFMRGAAKVGQFAGMLGSVPLALAEKSLGTEGILTDPYFKALDELTKDAIDYWTPRPNEVGRVGQVLGSLAEIAPPLMLTGGNPAVLVGSTTADAGVRLTNQGVGTGTASTVATIEGLATYVGFKLPVLGKTLTQRVGTGVAGNVALGAASRAGESEILESQGYEHIAEQYKITGESVFVDALSGALFGSITHLTAPREPAINPDLTVDQADALMTARTAKSFSVDAAPGKPVGTPASVAHQQALEESLGLLARGEPASVAKSVAENEGAAFTPDGKIEESRKLADTVQEEIVDRPVSPEPLTVETDDTGGVTVRSEHGATEFQESGPYLISKRSDTTEGHRRTGEGTVRAVRGVREAESRGLVYGSDVSVSPDQARVYGRLEKLGYEVTRNPAEVNPETGNLVSADPRKPVFEVRSRKPPEQVSKGSLDEALTAKEGEAEQPAPELEPLRMAAEATPDARVATGVDEDGAIVYGTAAEAYETARVEHEQALKDTEAYEAAVNCFIGAGS